MGEVDWKLGVEVELKAPPRLTRRDLADELAASAGGSVRTFFHPQTEPSKVPGKPIFHNLTLGFEASDAQGRPVARCVDDLTLVADFNRQAPPRNGWYRIVGDDQRLLRLVARFADPEKDLPEALDGVLELFQTEPRRGAGGMLRVIDEMGAPVCIAAPLPGERERPCEIVTPPLESQHREHLSRLLGTAKRRGFTIPREAATHLHFDAAALCSAGALANLVEMLAAHALNLRRLVGTNPACQRLGSWPAGLYELVRGSGFRDLGWDRARDRLAGLELSKYCDFNLKNIALGLADKHTFEVRILPGHIEPEPILEAAALFESILRRAADGPPVAPRPQASWSETSRFIESLDLRGVVRERWLERVAEEGRPSVGVNQAKGGAS